MGKAVPVPPQVPEVAEDGSAEQDEENAESNGSQQEWIIAEPSRLRARERTQ